MYVIYTTQLLSHPCDDCTLLGGGTEDRTGGFILSHQTLPTTSMNYVILCYHCPLGGLPSVERFDMSLMINARTEVSQS